MEIHIDSSRAAQSVAGWEDYRIFDHWLTRPALVSSSARTRSRSRREVDSGGKLPGDRILPHQVSSAEEEVQPQQNPSPTERESFNLLPKYRTFARRFCKVTGFLFAIIAGSYFRKDKDGQLILAPIDTLACWSAIFFTLLAFTLFVLAATAFRESPQRLDESLIRVQVAEEQLEASLAQRNTASTPPEGDHSHLALANLWTVTRARLHQYHGIALGQAKKSFRNAQAAMLIGFALLVGFTALALKADTTAGSAAAAVLGSVSATLAGFVSRTFIRSQESAAAHLQRYFDQPLEFSRYLAAERLIADSKLSGEQRAEVLTALVRAMISGPPSDPPPADGKNSNPQ
jgi:hypothetical protein